jgi:hypothetical protein
MAPEVKTAKNSKLPKLPEKVGVLSQLEKVGGHPRYLTLHQISVYVCEEER